MHHTIKMRILYTKLCSLFSFYLAYFFIDILNANRNLGKIPHKILSSVTKKRSKIYMIRDFEHRI